MWFMRAYGVCVVAFLTVLWSLATSHLAPAAYAVGCNLLSLRGYAEPGARPTKLADSGPQIRTRLWNLLHLQRCLIQRTDYANSVVV